MLWADPLSHFDTLDFSAVLCLVAFWYCIGWIIENPPRNRPSVSKLMVFYRREWLLQFVERNTRVFDAQILGNLRQGTAFFASATMIAIGGGMALIGNTERLAGVADDLSLDKDPAFVWEIKLVVVLIFVANAFLKFVWAHRLFGYCSVIMSAVPNDPDHSLARPRAHKAAEINVTAARSFNRAMRSVYFGLAATAWLAGAIPLILASSLTLLVLWRREFASHSRSVLIEATDSTPPAA